MKRGSISCQRSLHSGLRSKRKLPQMTVRVFSCFGLGDERTAKKAGAEGVRGGAIARRRGAGHRSGPVRRGLQWRARRTRGRARHRALLCRVAQRPCRPRPINIDVVFGGARWTLHTVLKYKPDVKFMSKFGIVKRVGIIETQLAGHRRTVERQERSTGRNGQTEAKMAWYKNNVKW